MAEFSLTMHPASEGDALALTWGEAGSLHHGVIDLGRTADYRALRPWLVATATIDLFVVSHIDADHIERAMPLVKEAVPPFQPADTWFNGYDHLSAAKHRQLPVEPLSPDQGNKLSDGIERFNWPWNAAFGDGPVSTDSPPMASPLHGLTVTLLGPSDKELIALEKVWAAALKAAALRRGDADEAAPNDGGRERLEALNVAALAAKPFAEDQAEANGSSIVLLAEYGGKPVLLGADAHPGVIKRQLRALGYGPDKRLRLDLFKLCHHASKYNLSPGLLALIDCQRFAISTDGSKHNHPDHETIARILLADPHRSKTFYFNTRQENATIWDDPTVKAQWNYACIMLPEDSPGLKIDV